MAIDKEALAQKILDLEGLTSEERSQLLGLIREKKSYGLVWEDKPEDAEKQMEQYLPTLKEDKDKYIPGSSPDSPNHIIIEGDNLHALTSLMFTHEGKIDVIYIDPPYNTGNEDFVYNDVYVDKEDDYRHSKWLTFMTKRLKIAKDLLSDRGVIFISIDDNEQAQLKLICDEIFKPKNFVCEMIWEQGRKSMAAQIAINHEYCLIYCKNKEYCSLCDRIFPNHNWSIKKDGLKEIYQEFESLKRFYGEDYLLISNGMVEFYNSLPENHPSKRHSHYRWADEKGLYCADNISQGTGKGGRFDVIHPTTGKPCKLPSGGWRFSEKRLPSMLKENRIHFGKDETIVPCLKRYLKETEYEVAPSVFYKDGRGASKRLDNLVGKGLFDYPKDEEVIARLLSFHTSYEDEKNYIILDFFAGSGTTLHATMQLNEEDGGKRQCILVNINENGICENVTYERNKRVIEGHTTPKGNHVDGLKNNSLRYYRTELKVPREITTASMRQLMEVATDMLCIKHDLYEEKRYFGGRKLKPAYTRYFDDGKGNRMLIIYNEEMIEHLVPLIAETPLNEGEKIQVYVFSPSADPFTQEFEEVIDKVELSAMPSAIYNVYKRVLKPLEPEWLQGMNPQEDSSTQTEEL